MTPLHHVWFLALAAVVVQIHNLQTMGHQSDLVVHAVAVDQMVERDARGRLLTWTELRVLDLRSAHPERMTEVTETLWLAQLGGHLGGETLVVPGASTVEVGDEFVLFAMQLASQPDTVIPHTLGAGLLRVGASVTEEIGDIVTAQGGVPAARGADDLDTFWRQVGLVPGLQPHHRSGD